MDELYDDNNTLDFSGFQGDAVAVINKMWNEWHNRYERRQKEAKEYIKRRHKAEIADAANQYEA